MTPFSALAADVRAQSGLRAAITGAYRRPEEECVAALLEQVGPEPALVRETAERLVNRLRAKKRGGGVEGLLQEYALSSQEGVALMCLAEALLRIPDAATRDALIRDKIGKGDWERHLGASASVFVNAATWGLLITGKLTAVSSEGGLASALGRLVARGGEKVVRAGVQMAMRLMGEQFVVGETIGEALGSSRHWEAKGFLYSYDMLGEAALTANDAARYLADYEAAIHAIGKAAGGRGIYAGPGISVKLSALHPRYGRAQRGRVMEELLPRLVGLARLARGYDIGLNIDAEEAERLDVSLDLLEAVCFDEAMAGWDGMGFVVQAYQKRAPFVIDYLVDLAARSGRRLMVRLVKGAYWDSEIKRAQSEGLEGFPVFTRKVHTDVSYLACAAKMLAAGERIFPQFATHNAQTVARVLAMAGEEFWTGKYEFQCLHGMGEALYEEVVGAGNLGRPCRIYAPVGTHETLLAYLVRRLLENGANTSFVNKIADSNVDVAALVEDPVAAALRVAPVGAGHEKIVLPAGLFGNGRRNSAGMDLSNEAVLGTLVEGMRAGAARTWGAAPILDVERADGAGRAVVNPADGTDTVGWVVEAAPAMAGAAFEVGLAAAAGWAGKPAVERAAVLERAAALLEDRLAAMAGLIVREAGKTIAAAVGEVREAVDFLRYYAAQVSGLDERSAPLGVVVAISPWNFPLAIFMGQVAAGLAAGNVVLAKPAEETPLVAAEGLRILLEAGVPAGAVQLLPGDGAMGAALVADKRVSGVMFTGSTEVARKIQGQLAGRADARGMPIAFIAETGGQNAMVVDSSALPEQVVADILTSAFDSAGQRCSALRILLVQEDVADRLMTMLRGAMAQLRVGRPDELSTDVGPVISAAARDGILAHVTAMRGRGFAVSTTSVETEAVGFFAAPTVIEIPEVAVLGREVFGPVLHVVRYKREGLERVVGAVNDLGYGLTFGVHSRIEEKIARVTALIRAGNIYVNRNIVGAVVGVQPFGGRGLSGTGPKAGGPLYVRRLLAEQPTAHGLAAGPPDAKFAAFLAHLRARGEDVDRLEAYGRLAPAQEDVMLPGPVGETNAYRLAPRGRVLCRAATAAGAVEQVAAALAGGNVAVVRCGEDVPALGSLPAALEGTILLAGDEAGAEVALFEGHEVALGAFMADLAAREGPVVTVHGRPAGGIYPVEFLMAEKVISTNTAAAGGNASLMTIG